jgi:aminocarboxymuconate-semialdehyde decarboxylase
MSARARGTCRIRRAATIDTHAHWYPRPFIALLEQGAAANGGSMGRTRAGHPVFSLPGLEPKSVMRPTMVEPELMLQAMDRRRVDVCVVSLTNPMVYWAPPEFGLALARAWNDACAELHRAWPQRFIGTIQLPMQAPRTALAEFERAARLPGMRAVYLATHVNGKNLDEPEFRPIFARCAALGLPVFLHPLYPCGGARIARHFMRNLCGNPYETGLAAAALALSGMLDAFPRLVVMLPQAGGAYPWLAGRFDRGWKVRGELQHLARRPSRYLRRFYYDTITHEPRILKFLIELVGADRIVLGTDYDQDMQCERPVEFVERIAGLGRREREMILGGNARRLLRLE